MLQNDITPASPSPSGEDNRPHLLIRIAVCVAVGGIALMFAMLVVAAARALLQEGSSTPWEWIWQPYAGHFGILPMLMGSLCLAAFAICIGWPAAFALTIWRLSEQRPIFRKLARFCGAIIRFMSAIPTVVYGFAAVFLLTPLVRDLLGGSGLCLFSAGVMLILLALPGMCLVLETALAPRLASLCPWGLAIGFSRLDLLLHFVCPNATRAFASAAILGFGRALGDTLIPLMLAGNAPAIPTSPDSGIRTLTAHMALVTANEVGGAAYNSLFLAGVILLLTNAGASLILRRLGADGR